MTTNVGSFTIKTCAMDDSMKDFAQEIAKQANTQYNENDMARYMKK